MESDVREKILETARCIFLKEGYKGTTINSIARAAGISPSTIYLHFNGKKDLFENLDISEEEALQDAYNANRTSILQTALILLGNTAMTGYLWICWPGSRAIPSTLYQYFKDKEELYSAVMQETPFYFNFLSIQPEIDGYDLEAAIKKIGLAYLAVFDTPERIAFTRAIIRDSKRHPEVSSIYHKNGSGYVARCVETVLKRYTWQSPRGGGHLSGL